MDFARKNGCISHISEKYKFFSASYLFPKEIPRKLDEINADLTAAHSIRTSLLLNLGRNEKLNILLLLVHQTINALEAVLAAVNNRMARLQEVNNALNVDDEDDIDEILRSILYV